ncbi:MAG: hypothetical protein HPY68_05460 [Candidatus Atribacteria bacterium]|nr:hypothetical protein [Candidatus Atribacteria bacterium]
MYVTCVRTEWRMQNKIFAEFLQISVFQDAPVSNLEILDEVSKRIARNFKEHYSSIVITRIRD